MPTEKETHEQADADDRSHSSGNQYGRDQNKSGEGNDPSLTEGPTITRTVPPAE